MQPVYAILFTRSQFNGKMMVSKTVVISSILIDRATWKMNLLGQASFAKRMSAICTGDQGLLLPLLLQHNGSAYGSGPYGSGSIPDGSASIFNIKKGIIIGYYKHIENISGLHIYLKPDKSIMDIGAIMCNYPDIDSLFLYDGYGLGACDESKAYHFDKNIVKFFHRINNLCTKNVNGSFWMVGEDSTDIVKYIVENDQVTK